MSSLDQDGPDPGVPARADAGTAALVEVGIQEVLEDLVAVRKKKRRHALWAILGLSPAALLPAVGLLMEGSLGLLIILGVLVTGTQIYGWSKSLKREEELEESLRRLREEV